MYFQLLNAVSSGQPQAGETLCFTDHQTCVVGRSRKAHLRLSDNRQFSRFHCRLEINPPTVTIIDLDSTNGTKVNGQRIDTASLIDGDVVTVGDTTFKVVVTKPVAKPLTPKTPLTLVKTAVSAQESITAEGLNRQGYPVIPGYELERQLGQGAMGAVFLARRLSTSDKVAIKVMRPLVAADRKAIEKFRREASIILRLQHKRIVKCMDFRLSDDHLPYLVMEYIEEIAILPFLDALEFSERVRVSTGIMARLLEGLQYAHAREIVHRDVKPSNILAYRSGSKLQVKLADFGLAKNYIDAGFSNCSTSNEICGTLAYMSPEQIMNCRYAKPACDIYAAGVCLYNLISGRLPYEATQTAGQIALILNQSPTSITDHVTGIPEAILGILTKSLSRDPSDRFVSAEAMRAQQLPFSSRR